MLDFRKRTGLLSALGAFFVIGLLLFVLDGNIRADIMRMLRPHGPPPTTTIYFFVELPGCTNPGGKPFTKSGFYVGSGNVNDTSSTCGAPSGTGLRTIPAGDFASFCVGQKCSGTPDQLNEYITQAREIIAWSQRVNQIMSTATKPKPYSDGTNVKISLELPDFSGFSAGPGILCSKASQSKFCTVAVTTPFTICMISDKRCTQGTPQNLPELYAYADAALALVETTSIK